MSGWLSDKGWGGDLASPGPIGNVTPSTGAFTTLSATTSVTSPIVKANGSGGGVLQSSNGTQCMQWGGGGGANVTIDGGFSAAASVTLQAGTANGVVYLNGSKAATSGSGLVFDGSNFLIGTSNNAPTQDANFHEFRPGGDYTIGHVTGSVTGTGYIIFTYGGAAIGLITQNGTTGVLYGTSSDQRLKENIVNAPDAASIIDSIQVRSFDWKSDGSHQRYGMIAQELLEVAPEAVSVPADEKEMMGVDYSKLVPMLVKEIQSLRLRVAQLEQ